MDLPASTADFLTPAARPVASDERFLDLRQEVDKLGALTDSPVDWRLVADLGAALTRDIGKDLGVIAYTAFARFKLRDLAGLLAAVVALASLLRAPPPTLTPAKPRLRGASLEWLLTRLHHGLSALAPTPADAVALADLEAALRDLHAASQDALADMSPRFGPTLQVLAALRADLPAPTGTTPPPDATATTAPRATPPPPARDEPATIPPASAPAVPPAADPSVSDRTALAAWLVPLAVSPPCGPDPAGHDVFDSARQQLARLSAVTGEAVDWPRVESDSHTLLTTIARDLRPATWLALARCRRRDLPGFTLAVRLIATLLADFPEAVHPRKPKTRRDTLDWFFKQAASALADLPAADLRAADLDALDAARRLLADALDAHLPDAPSLRPLRDALQRVRERLPERPPPPPSSPQTTADPPSPALPASQSPPSQSPANPPSQSPPSQSPANPPSQSPPSQSPANPPSQSPPSQSSANPPSQSPANPPSQSTPSQSPTNPPSQSTPASPAPLLAPPLAIKTTAVAAPASSAELDRFLTATADALLEAARGLREASSADPRAYRLLRTGLWIHLTAPPPVRPDGNTGIPGLDERDRGQLAELVAAARWPVLLTRCENLLVRHRLALDLQRLTCAALLALGPEHADAALAVRAELRALLTRLPALPQLRDRDGQPLADPATRKWIAESVLPAPGHGAPTDDPSYWTDLAPRLRGADRPAALAEAQAKIDAGASGQRRCIRRLALAETVLAADDPPLAYLLFSVLADDLTRAGADAWDPPLAARCLAAAARCPAPPTPPSAALLRLARVDIAAAAETLALPPR